MLHLLKVSQDGADEYHVVETEDRKLVGDFDADFGRVNGQLYVELKPEPRLSELLLESLYVLARVDFVGKDIRLSALSLPDSDMFTYAGSANLQLTLFKHGYVIMNSAEQNENFLALHGGDAIWESYGQFHRAPAQ